MQDKINRAKDIVRHGKVKQISDAFWEVENHQVALKSKTGRSFFTCDCLNYSLYCNSNPICIHQLSVIIFLSENEFYKKIDKLIEDYKRIGELKLKIDTDIVINDLENLRRVK